MLFRVGYVIAGEERQLQTDNIMDLFRLFFLVSRARSLSATSRQNFRRSQRASLPTSPTYFSGVLRELLHTEGSQRTNICRPLTNKCFVSRHLRHFYQQTSGSSSFFFTPTNGVHVLKRRAVSKVGHVRLILLNYPSSLFSVRMAVF